MKNVVKQAFTETSASGTELNIDNTIEAKMNVSLYGNASQDGEPTPDTPIPVNVVTGDNSITISNNDNTQSQTYPINLGSMELCKIGDYQDRIVKDNGKWYKYGAIGKVVLAGSEPWTNGFGTNLFDIQGYFNDKPFIIGYGLSNYYKYNSVQRGINNETVNGEFALQMANLNYNIFFKNTDYSSPTDFKTWLSANKPTIYYVRKSAIDIEITDTTLINQLDEISQALSQKGTTIISQSNDNLPFNLDVIALTK